VNSDALSGWLNHATRRGQWTRVRAGKHELNAGRIPSHNPACGRECTIWKCRPKSFCVLSELFVSVQSDPSWNHKLSVWLLVGE
jgi:hypothetical protein